jgi:hypothetical protein
MAESANDVASIPDAGKSTIFSIESVRVAALLLWQELEARACFAQTKTCIIQRAFQPKSE